MKENKFRAWDKKDKKMIYPQSQQLIFVSTLPSWGLTTHYKSKKGSFDESIFDWADADLISERYIPMQYVGRKDQNGQEMYEEDIITFPHYVYDDDKILQINGKIIWNQTECCYLLENLTNASSTFMLDIDTKYIKIIGNSYETPELLKEV